jgi:hypothetical protein
MWFAGSLAALSSITYPSISAFVSIYAKENQQGMNKQTISISSNLFSLQVWFKVWLMVFVVYVMVLVQLYLVLYFIYLM